MKGKTLLDFGSVSPASAVYLYSEDWRLTEHIDVPPSGIAMGRTLDHNGTTFEIFEIGANGAFAAPRALLPRRIRYPWRRTEIADLIADVFDVDETARWRDWLGDFWEWVDEIDDVLPHGAHEAVGWSLNDDDEAAAVQPFLDRRNALIDNIGNAPFDRYETDPRWVKVREAGSAALAALGRSV